MKENITDQQKLWDAQHYDRGGDTGIEGTHLVDTPNQAALLLHTKLPRKATILEIGCANGRDARFWASQGHRVIAADFSRVALTQLEALAKKQGVEKNITTVRYDLNDGQLPITPGGFIDAFYARSALHIDDKAMFALGDEINRIARPGAVVLIEGKTECDPRIKRSTSAGDGLVVDFDGHLRRVFEPDFMVALTQKAGWHSAEMCTYQEEGGAEFLRFLAVV